MDSVASLGANNMKQLLIYEGNQIRVRKIEDEVWFVAKDVCKVLEIKNSRDALYSLDDDEKGVVLTDTPGGRQKMLNVNEFGLYSLIFKSRKPEARKFKRWVTHEVLPSIRKTGSYGAPQTLAASSATDESIQILKNKALAFLEVVNTYDTALKMGRLRSDYIPGAGKTLQLMAFDISFEANRLGEI